MQNLFLIMPAWMILVLFIAFSFLVTYVAFRLFRVLFSVQELEKFKDVTGIYVSMIGVLYGVFLAFIVIAIWENYDHVKSNIDHETDALSNIYRDAQGLPKHTQYAIDSCVKQYVLIVVQSEWPMLGHNMQSKDAMQARSKLQSLIMKLKPQTLGEQVVFTQMLHNLNELAVARRNRVNTSDAGLPGILWIILIGGAVLLIFYIACFYVENQKFHLWLAFGVSGLIAILLFVALELNYPFAGSNGLTPDSFKTLSSHNVEADTAAIKTQP